MTEKPQVDHLIIIWTKENAVQQHRELFVLFETRAEPTAWTFHLLLSGFWMALPNVRDMSLQMLIVLIG